MTAWFVALLLLAPRPLSAYDPAAGKRLYLQHCAVCHGATGEGGVGPDLTSPASNFAMRGTGQKGWFGWAEDAKIEELRDAWFATTDAAASKKAADAVQARAFEFVPYVPTAQFILPTAYRTNLSGVIIAPITLMWNVEKR